MPAKRNLVPSVITDVNGKVTTVYRKPQQEKTVRSLPVPALTPQQVIDYRDGLLDCFVTYLNMDVDMDPYVEVLKKELASYDGEFIKELDDAVGDDNDDFVKAIAGYVLDELSVTFIREHIRFMREAGTPDMERASLLVQSLHEYPQLSEYADLAKASDSVQDKCVDLLNVVRVLSEQDAGNHSGSLEYLITSRVSSSRLPPMPVIKDIDFVDMVMESRESAERIMSLAREHGTADTSAIKGIMRWFTPSLAQGAL